MKTHPNPVKTQAFEFVEFSSKDPQKLKDLFHAMGFTECGQHQSHNVILFKQGNIQFFVNEEPADFSATFTKAHGPCACSMGFRVDNIDHAMKQLLARGAKEVDCSDRFLPASIRAIEGIGGAHLYVVDAKAAEELYAAFPKTPIGSGMGLLELDHLTHNVYQGQMDVWAGYYEKLFDFYEIRFFDIKGQRSGLHSRAMSAPCGKIRIPLNESTDDVSQIAEYLDEYKGEGIQHIALTTDNIYDSVERLRDAGIPFLNVPSTYYQDVPKRLPFQKEDLPRMERNHILIDGDKKDETFLLQIFTKNAIGPIFFEIIQRHGHQGFGEGNFQALFDALERDQIERGVLKA